MVALLSARTESAVKAVSLESIDEVLRQLGPGPTRLATVETIRQAVLRDVDINVNRKSEEMWKKGRAMLQQMELKQKDLSTQHAENVAKVQEKQYVLEGENAWLKQALADLSDKFSKLGAMLASDATTAPIDIRCNASGLQTPPHQQNSEALPAHWSGNLPEVPAFPFVLPPAPMPTAAPPLSLVNALGVSAPPREVLARQRTPLSLMETLAPPAPPAFPSPPGCPATDSNSYGFPDEPARSVSPPHWQSPLEQGHGLCAQSENKWDEEQSLDLAVLHSGCSPLLSPQDYSSNGSSSPGFALRADYSPNGSSCPGSGLSANASVFVPMVPVAAV